MGQLNDRYKQVLDKPSGRFAWRRPEGKYSYYDVLQEKVGRNWETISSNRHPDRLPFCCGVAVIGNLQLPSNKSTMLERDECLALQIKSAFKSCNYVLYSAVVESPKNAEEGHALGNEEVQNYRKIVNSLKRMGFAPVEESFPNRGSGNIILVLGARAHQDDLTTDYDEPNEDEDWD